MSCVDLMYQFYSPYFSYKSPAADDTSAQKFSSQSIYDAGLTTGPATTAAAATAATTNNFLENPTHLPHHHPHPHHHSNTNHTTHSNPSSNNNHSDSTSTTKDTRDSEKNSPHHHNQQQLQQQQQQHPQQQQHQQQPHSQPRTTHYLTSNCVLFTYFSGETGTVVDEHFSRALSQPSSFTLDKPPPNDKSYSRSESLLMCHRKLPPSFWNSSYQPPPCTTGGGSNFAAFGADAYFQSSLYNLHKTWPYHYGPHSQSHTYPHHQSTTHGLHYPSMDSTGRLSSHYGSFMMPGPSLSSRVPAESRAHSQYDFSKTSADAFSNYYGMGRFGSEVETGLPGWS